MGCFSSKAQKEQQCVKLAQTKADKEDDVFTLAKNKALLASKAKNRPEAVSKQSNGLFSDLPPPGEEGLGTDALLGVAKVVVEEAQLKDKGHYNVTLSMGLQSFLSQTLARTRQPKFQAERNVVLLRGAHVLHLLVHRIRGNMNIAALKRTPVGVASVDLLDLFPDISCTDIRCKKAISLKLCKPTAIRNKGVLNCGQKKSNLESGVFEECGDDVVGTIMVSVERASLEDLEVTFWQGLISIVDWDDSGTLEKQEFQRLMLEILYTDDQDVTPEMQAETIEYLWNCAEEASGESKCVNADVLSKVLCGSYKKHEIKLRRCPISGAKLHPTNTMLNHVYMLFQMNSGMGRNLQGGFRTVAQANRSWCMRLTKWALEPAPGNLSSIFRGTRYYPGLNKSRNAAHVIVYNRSAQILEEEVISPMVVLALRNMYQSPMGMFMKATGAYSHLKEFSKVTGAKMDDPSSKLKIKKFVKAYKGQLDVSEIAEDLDSFATFNEFFYRHLKPGARPIAFAEDDTVLVSAADCRLMAYGSAVEAKQFWIKASAPRTTHTLKPVTEGCILLQGRLFSIAGLLASKQLGEEYEEASLFIFRLAPQDYHRFHSPVSGVIQSIVEIPGQLYTVNPIAVNSPMCDVLTENKRIRVSIQTKTWGTVQFVAIGATAVGSIIFTVRENQRIKKGDELGYFAFGGSTCILLVPPDLVAMDADIQHLSSKSVETYVKMGEQIGVSMVEAAQSTSLPQDLPPVNVVQEANQYSTAKHEKFRQLALIQEPGELLVEHGMIHSPSPSRQGKGEMSEIFGVEENDEFFEADVKLKPSPDRSPSEATSTSSSVEFQ